jgi:Protein of unknown function (DUF3168)
VSYAFAADLQAGIYARLAADDALAALVGAAVYDAPPALTPEATDYVTLGEETVRDYGTQTSDGAIHDFVVTAHSGRDGFDGVKRVAAAVCAALVDAPLVLAAGRLVALRFVRANAERGRAPGKRRVTLRFRAIVDQD